MRKLYFFNIFVPDKKKTIPSYPPQKWCHGAQFAWTKVCCLYGFTILEFRGKAKVPILMLQTLGGCRGGPLWCRRGFSGRVTKAFVENLQFEVGEHVWLVVSNIFYVHPYLGKIPIWPNIFQLGWNHQLDVISLFESQLGPDLMPCCPWSWLRPRRNSFRSWFISVDHWQVQVFVLVWLALDFLLASKPDISLQNHTRFLARVLMPRKDGLDVDLSCGNMLPLFNTRLLRSFLAANL